MAFRILIVDDSALFRQGVRERLEANPDWEVCGEAADGLQAIEMSRKLMPQLVIMDFSMPRMSGLEAAHAILKEFPKVPILLLTLYLSHHLSERARDLGIRAALSKTDMQYLFCEIEAVLSSKKLTDGDNRSKTRQS